MSELKYDCTDQEHIDWVLNNQKHGGGFQHYLVEAWRRADGENRAKLEKAFPYDYRIPLGKPKQTREEWLEKFRPLDKPIMKYARQCSITGEGMNQGYIVGDCTPVKYEKDLIALIRSWDVDVNKELSDEYILAESYKEEEYYYTEWEDESEHQYEEINGKLIEIQ